MITEIFLIKSFFGGLLLSLIFALIGIFLVNKRLSFLSDGLAHASLTGLALGVLLNFNPIIVATLVSIIFSLLIRSLQKGTHLHGDALIGIIFTFGFSLGLILLLFSAKYQTYVLNYLLGNILTLSNFDLLLIVFLFLAVSFLFLKFKNFFILWLIDESYLKITTKASDLIELSLYIILAIVLILGIKLAGVILVSALMIIPPTTAKLLARSFKEYTGITLFVALFGFSLGYLLSFLLNLPTTPVIVLTHTLIFFITFLIFSSLRYNR